MKCPQPGEWVVYRDLSRSPEQIVQSSDRRVWVEAGLWLNRPKWRPMEEVAAAFPTRMDAWAFYGKLETLSRILTSDHKAANERYCVAVDFAIAQANGEA